MKYIYVIIASLLLVVSQTGCGSKSPQPTSGAAPADTSAASPAEAGDATAAEEADPVPEQLTPEQIEARKIFEQGVELARKDEDQKASEAYLDALRLDPDFAEAHLRLAMSYDVLRKKDEAEAEYKKAAEAYQKFVRKNHKDARAFYNMGLAYSRLRKPDEAVKAFRQAVKLDPENSDSQYEFGIALGKAALFQEAVLALEKATTLDPDNYRAQEALEAAKINLQRWQSMIRQQEAVAKRQGGGKDKNANTNASSNVATPTSPLPEIH
jgi:tetratricopeptide (TPR) repeat protein